MTRLYKIANAIQDGTKVSYNEAYERSAKKSTALEYPYGYFHQSREAYCAGAEEYD